MNEQEWKKAWAADSVETNRLPLCALRYPVARLSGSAAFLHPKTQASVPAMIEKTAAEARRDLTDLVDYPDETLEVELKEWVDLADRSAQAKIAKHIAALANHGGGYVLFGFRNDNSVAPDPPSDMSCFNRDNVSAIVKRYLTPPFQCEVELVRASTGNLHPVVRVPSHGATPIAAKSDGPSDAKGQPQGIKSGTYYIRKPGPESAPIQGAEEWQPLIRRCLIADRDGLLADIARVVQPKVEQPAHAVTDRLKKWHEESDARWRAIVASSKLDWPVDITEHHCQLSYMILSESELAIPSDELRWALEAANRDVRQTVWTGWSMFYPFTQPEIAAAFHPESQDDGTGADVLESNLVGENNFDYSLPDYWRYSVDGRATIIRPYREDRQRTASEVGRSGGTWLSPETIIRETAEIVTHARLMAERYVGSGVAFRCTWKGLADRKLDDWNGYWSPGQIARAGQRTTANSWDIAFLAANWHEVVAHLACPVLSLFSFNDCSAEFVARLAPRFAKL